MIPTVYEIPQKLDLINNTQINSFESFLQTIYFLIKMNLME